MKDQITIKYDGDKSIVTESGRTLADLLSILPARSPQPVAAIVNGNIQEFDYLLNKDSDVVWLDYTSTDGHRIYKRSVIFIMILAAQRVLPGYRLKVNHSLENGSYCQLLGKDPISAVDIARLEKEMQTLVSKDLPIMAETLNKKEVIAYYLSRGKIDKAALIAKHTKRTTRLYHLEELCENLFGIIANHTGILNNFHLVPFDEGFVLRLPTAKDIGFAAGPFTEPRHLQAVLREYDKFYQLLGVNTTAELNQIVAKKGITELSMIGETMQERALHRIADNIASDFPTVRIVLVAGPSSSGKTTFTHRLAIQFRTMGLQPIIISLDNYFIDRDKTPLDQHGDRDYESINALDLTLFNANLLALLKGEKVHTPIYNFITGTRKKETLSCCLGENKIILIEGIHGLNESLTPAIPQRNKRKIYVSALTQLNMDDYTPIPSSDTRLCRRIVRDMQFRSHTPEKTIEIWDSVRRGEFKNIFPFQENADYYFNSALVHEFSVMRPLLEPALKDIPLKSASFITAQRLLQFIKYFSPVSHDCIPCDSILREFIGDSCDPFK